MINNSEFRMTKLRATVSSGGMIKFLREKKGWTQSQLSEMTKISVTNISALERDRQEIGKKRAEVLAKAFGIHPVSIMYPDIQAQIKLVA